MRSISGLLPGGAGFPSGVWYLSFLPDALRARGVRQRAGTGEIKEETHDRSN